MAITHQMLYVGRLVGIPVLDHVIISRPAGDGQPMGYYSLRDSGDLDRIKTIPLPKEPFRL